MWKKHFVLYARISHMMLESVRACLCVCVCACVRARDVVTGTSRGCRLVPGLGSKAEV